MSRATPPVVVPVVMSMRVVESGEHRKKSLPDGASSVKWKRKTENVERKEQMQILFAPHGTRGDIQPLIALARALGARGHRIRFVVPENAVAWVRGHGFACESTGVDIEAEVRAMESRTLAMARHVGRLGREIGPRLFESVARAAADADLLVSSGVPLSTSSVAEARGIPHVYALFCPGALPNDAGPPLVLRRQTLPRWLNRLLWRALPLFGDLALRSVVNAGRASLGLAPTSRPSRSVRTSHVIVAADAELAPATEMPPRGLRTDAWILDEAQTLDARVTAFVRGGPPPVYVGFGSMVAPRSLALGRCVVAAARTAGRRLIVAGGWAGLDDGISGSGGDGILAISDAPHAALFPLMAAVVHHGGAGTTTAAARAGVPQVIVPHILDQFYWAHRVEVLGLGPRSLRLDDISPEVLAARIADAAGNQMFAATARELGVRAAGRIGTHEAVQYLERLIPALR